MLEDETASASRNGLERMIVRPYGERRIRRVAPHEISSYAPAWKRKPETLQRLVRRTPGHPKLRKAPSPRLSRLRAVALQRAGPEGEGVWTGE